MRPREARPGPERSRHKARDARAGTRARQAAREKKKKRKKKREGLIYLDLRDSAFGRETAATTRLRKARQRCLRQRWQWQAGWTTTPRHDTTRAQVRQGVELSSASQNKNVKLLGRRARRVREWCERSRICVCACECVRVVRVCVCECTIRLPGC
jgi:hypothetical protein